MDEFGVYAIFGVNGPPQRLLRAEGSWRVSAAVPPSVRQVVLFSSGPWGERICVNAELNDADQIPITIGKLTPYNKCLSWEQWEEETWTDGVTLNVSLEGGNLNPTAPLADRELSGKRKRERSAEEDGGDRMSKARGEENICPNGVGEKVTPVRKGKAGLFSPFCFSLSPFPANEAGATTPQNAARTKSRQAKTPTQTSSLVSPSGRWGQTLCPIDSQTAILIGGQGARMQFCKDPMWKLCTEDLSWVAAETLAEGPTPEARIGHSAIFDPDSKRIFVFGGSKNKKWFNDVHILDTQSWRWTMVEAQGKVPPLAYHSCSMFRGELFVLGGVFPRPSPEPDGCSDSLYIFDPHLSIWYQPIVTGDKPSPRSGYQNSIQTFVQTPTRPFSVVKTSGKAPSPRSWHGSAVLSETKFLIHGGYNGNNALSDTFIFDIDTNSWTELKLAQLSMPRAGHSIVTMETPDHHGYSKDSSVSSGRTLLVFGGGDNEGTFFSDVTSVSVEDLLAAA
uniref:Kelch repeat-containing protein n=1 Tax=Poecilia reticulata TaxID=8081 RepID=A0A3P9MVT3_POERE